jgi:predicted transcriptional regulator
MQTQQTNPTESPNTMIVRTPRLERDFTVLPNRALRDPYLSYRARGVLAYVLSMPDNWRTSADTLARQGLEGRDAIRASINELIRAGYARRVKAQDDRGRYTTELHFYDTPKAVHILGKLRGKLEQPTTDNQSSEIQSSKEELIPSTYKDLQSELGSEPKLCGYCNGQGVIAEGFAGLPTFCPDCKGDGLARS